jgi:hypothetical protein
MSLRASLPSVRLTPRTPVDGRDEPKPLLDPGGARVVLGAPGDSVTPAAPIIPSACTLFGPRSAALCANGGPLIVSDTGHHRLMIWKIPPRSDDTPADVVIGQPNFESEGRNSNAAAGPATLNVPTGIAVENGILAVADAWNHRVLLWHGIPDRSNQPADVVIGQTDFHSVHANRGADTPRADTLNWCYGLALHAGRLYVADTGNRRVLVWNEIPARNGCAADLVLGQRDFVTRDEVGSHEAAAGMRWPHALCFSEQMVFVADAGASRVMVWSELPEREGEPCSCVLGQSDFFGRDHNAGEYHPTAASLNMPYGVCTAAGQLMVADTANSRLLGFELGALSSGQPASRLTGQHTFTHRGDNRWEAPTRDSLCWPYGVESGSGTAVVADSGNNRVLLWDIA